VKFTQYLVPVGVALTAFLWGYRGVHVLRPKSAPVVAPSIGVPGNKHASPEVPQMAAKVPDLHPGTSLASGNALPVGTLPANQIDSPQINPPQIYPGEEVVDDGEEEDLGDETGEESEVVDGDGESIDVEPEADTPDEADPGDLEEDELEVPKP